MLDLVIISIIVVFGIIGYYSGFIKSIITLLSSVIALILSLLLYPIVNMFLKLTPLYTYVNGWIADKIAHIDFGSGVQTQGSAIAKNINWLPAFISDQMIKNNNQEVYKMLNVSNVTDYVSTYLTNMIIGMAAVIITWLILKVLLVMFIKTTDAIVNHLPGVSAANKMGGLALGTTKGLLAIWGIYLLVPILIAYPVFSRLNEEITSGYIASWLYENNMILLLFQRVFKI